MDLREPEIRFLAGHSLSRIWEQVSSTRLLRISLFLFSILGFTHSAAALRFLNGILECDGHSRSWLNELAALTCKGSAARSFSSLTPHQREKLIELYAYSPFPLFRRAVQSLRLYYLYKTYEGPLGFQLTDHPGKDGDPYKVTRIDLPEFKTHLVYDQRTTSLQGDLDYIIVGSGPGGSVAAAEICDRGRKALILDRGGFFMPGSREARNDPVFLKNGGLQMNRRGDIIIGAADVVGGGSSVNLDLAFLPTADICKPYFEDWRRQGLLGSGSNAVWTPEELEQTSRLMETRLRLWTPGETDINPNNDILRRGADAHGSSWYHQMLSLRPADIASSAGGNDYHKTSAVETFLLPAMDSRRDHPLTLLSCAKVKRILTKRIQGQRMAVGVEFTLQQAPEREAVYSNLYPDLKIPVGKTIRVYAKHVILSGGAIGSTAILNRSGFKHPMHGRGLVTHPCLPLIAIFPERVNIAEGLPSSVYVDHYTGDDLSLRSKLQETWHSFLLETSLYPPQRFAVMLPGDARGVCQGMQRFNHVAGLAIVFFDEVDLDNRLRISAKRIAFDYELTDQDRQRYVYAIAESLRIMLKAGAQEVYLPFGRHHLPRALRNSPGAHTEGPFVSILRSLEEVDIFESDFHWKPNTTWLYGGHLMGSNRIGSDPEKSIIDLDHAVRGWQNLYVVDSSVFPDSLGVNPAISTYVIAHLWAQRHFRKEEYDGA